jgi:Fanconi-associated nuclease 1
VRADLIAARLGEIEAGSASAILAEVEERERPKTTKVVGVRWTFTSEELQEFVDVRMSCLHLLSSSPRQCIGGRALSVICRVYAEDYEHRVGGVPDLLCARHRPHERSF